MVDLIFAVGLIAGLTLVCLLVVTLTQTSVAIWPVPMDDRPNGVVFWWLFRGLNCLAVVVSALDAARLDEGVLGVRVAAGVVAIAAFALFHLAGQRLGRENLYAGAEGLEVRGIYRFSRNPQYAAAMPGFLAGAIAMWSAEGVVLAGLMTASYMLMALAEEPWLERTYGDSYERYRRRVPRFYNVRAVWNLVAGELQLLRVRV